MSSLQAARTTRRLLTLASLGLAGLLVGLLGGCSSSPSPTNLATYTQPGSLDFNSTVFPRTHQPASLYTHPVPDLRHPPAPHRIESWTDRTPRQASAFPIQTDAAPTFTNYAFTNAHTTPSRPGAGYLSAQ
jgi:hypothetical protein